MLLLILFIIEILYFQLGFINSPAAPSSSTFLFSSRFFLPLRMEYDAAVSCESSWPLTSLRWLNGLLNFLLICVRTSGDYMIELLILILYDVEE